MSSRKQKRIERRLSRLVKRHGEAIGYEEMEMMLQAHAQKMREESEPNVTPNDIEGWSN